MRLIVAGVAIFLIGMVSMEDGFKLFSGGFIEKVLKKATSNVPKAIGAGFLATAVVQSSSLLTVITISFLSAGLISLSGAIGVIFGSNLGTTATAWIISSFGIKIDIAQFALPMIIFGVVFRFKNSKAYQGLGAIFIGLGFVFFGISYMKDGFDAMRDSIDLASYAIEGYLGVLVFIAVGAIATVVMQSSSATIALIITALAMGQIEYFNALSLAIGSNIGTTVTAILGSLKSNANGKRLAVAHLIFNGITALVAVLFLYQLAFLVDFLSDIIGIEADNYVLKLALFHTIFNALGILIVAPFIHRLVSFLKSIFVAELGIGRAKYLDNAVISSPKAAIEAIRKEVERFYGSVTESLIHALSFQGSCIADQHKKIYGQIIHYAILAQERMSEDEQRIVYELKVSCRDIAKIVKQTKELQKNLKIYLNSDNKAIKSEYKFLKKRIIQVLKTIDSNKNLDDDLDVLSNLEVLREEVDELDLIKSGKIDGLIRERLIEKKMATSLINDSAFVCSISTNLINIALVLWIKDSDIRNLRGDL